jgi:hypothetical protein
MNRSKSALALIVVGALMGCGGESASTNASAEPAKSGAASSQAQGSGKAAEKPAGGTTATAAATEAKKADAPAATPPAAGGSLFKHMPKDCAEGRVYANIAKILTPDTHDALDKLTTKMIAEGGADAKKGDEALKALKEGGIDPAKSVREVAVCANKEDAKTLVAVNMDMSKADKPGDVFAKAMEKSTGKAPKKEEIDGVTYLQSGEGKVWLAFVGKETLLVSEGKDTLTAAVKGAGGEADFAEAPSYVLWAKMTDNNMQIMAKEAGDNFDLTIKATDKNAAKIKSEFEKVQPELDKMADKMTAFKPLLPIGKNAKVEVSGENVTATTNFPKKAIADTLNNMKDLSLKDLEKQMRF